jgi:hypothetical protein
MESFRVLREPLARVVAVAIVAGAWSIGVTAAEPQAPPVKQGPPTKAALASWHTTILETRPKKLGCFVVTYPGNQWHQETCRTPPHKAYPPRHGRTTSLTQVGGNGIDFTPVVTGHISEAEGSFDTVTGVTSECTVACPGGTCPANPTCPTSTSQYSLQLNTEFFTTTTCGTPGNPGCLGWEQFVYEGGGGSGFIQYWLVNFGPTGTACPTPRGANCALGGVWSDGWCPFPTSVGTVDCAINAVNGAGSTATAITSLGTLKVTGSAAVTAGTTDAITVTEGSTAHSANGNNYFPDLATQWQQAEFNVFGDGSGDQAVFNSGATVNIRTGVTSGTSAGPGCNIASFTAESNNLTLGNTPPAAVKGSMPALLFWESNPPPAGAVATCADATSVGDTHLTTLGGLLYDFQASGDFVLAQARDFTVEARQVSGAPTWPNATVNKAVATQMGKTRVAVCTAPSRLEVDGANTEIGDGKTLSLPSGVNILHAGNVYLIGDQSGNSLRAEDNGSYMNVSVGLGRWPQTISGILVNAGGRVNAIATRAGRKLTAPFVLTDLYHEYADSWRVPANESLLSVCSREVEIGIPSKPFYANNLDPQVYRKTRATCTAAGVSVKPLLEACALDVAVIGQDTAARIYVGARKPIAVGRVVVSRGDHDHDHDKDHDRDRGHDKDHDRDRDRN